MTTTENMAIALARRKVSSFAEATDELMQRHGEAMECWDCQAYLKSGIETFQWLKRAEVMLREADAQGLFEFNSDIQRTMVMLYRAWQSPRDTADVWIRRLTKLGHVPDNLDEFEHVCSEVQDIVDRGEWQRAAQTSRMLASSEESW